MHAWYMEVRCRAMVPLQDSSPMSDLIFVYAVDGGLFNDIAAYAHKVLSPGTYPRGTESVPRPAFFHLARPGENEQ